MPTLWHHISQPDDATIREIASTIAGHGVVILPTDTIYGLHCIADDPEASARIDAIKTRDSAKPFVVIAESLDQVNDLGVVIGPWQRELLSTIWPAPLTAILPLERPIAASKGRLEIAVRVPDLVWLRRLLQSTGALSSTSLNLAGEPPIVDPQLSDSLLQSVDGVLDLGARPAMASTIVDLRHESALLIREGGFPFSQILWKTPRKTL